MKAVAALLAGAAVVVHADECTVADVDKVDCGFVGVTQTGCEAKGCCWSPAGQGSSTPWCYFKAGTAPTCEIIPTSAGSPFSSADVATMQQLFNLNLDIQGKGGVVASPDLNTPGGSYYFHWMRDGALSMKALLFTEGLTDNAKTKFEHYLGWVQRAQKTADPNQIDVRVEPKFMLPDGGVFTGGWCRPQTDGPALQAEAFMFYRESMQAAKQQFDEKAIWAVVSTDLDWVAANWAQTGCDLWEEIRSDGIFWNRFNFRAALLKGADFATAMGDSARASTYSTAAKAVEATLKSFEYAGGIMESSNRQADAAVVNSINNAYLGDGVYGFTSLPVASTVKHLVNVFCTMFPVNQAEQKAGTPGMFFGRYLGDSYAGGNPWVLLTAGLAELLYHAAADSAKTMPGADVLAVWKQTIQGFDDSSQAAVAKSFAAAGDGVLKRIEKYARPDGLHLNEQMDKNTGKQLSAKDLTWSYATVLRAITVRASLPADVVAQSSLVVLA